MESLFTSHFCQYQIILLDDIGLIVWLGYEKVTEGFCRAARSRTHVNVDMKLYYHVAVSAVMGVILSIDILSFSYSHSVHRYLWNMTCA